MGEPTLSSETDDILNLKFEPRARLLQLLGDELIRSPRLAVFELVKNCYDADATTVSVSLINITAINAVIRIEDDGEGMTVDTVRNVWLVPGHDHRALQRQASTLTRLGRLPLGEKGLGRFAAHKLGNRIEMVTRATGQSECVVSIDWTRLIRNEFLADATVRVIRRAPQVFSGTSGTRITISDLRQTWTRGDVRRLQRQIASISSPLNRGTDHFRTQLNVPGHTDWLDGVSDAETLLERAPWEYRFVFKGGHFDWQYKFRGVIGLALEPRDANGKDAPLLVPAGREERDFEDHLGTTNSRPQSIKADASWNVGIGTVRGIFYVFDRDREVLSRLGEIQFIRRFLDDNGGVRVYRDGIRVYNYGEEDDDWLGLDIRRINTPQRSVSRNILMGSVELSLADSVGLKEKTNREGFVENDAENRLKHIVRGALTPLEVERKKDKDRIRQIASAPRNRDVKRIRQPIQRLRVLATKRNVSDEFTPIIDRIERDYVEFGSSMLRAGLSGVGLAIVFHEIEQGVRGLCGLIEADGNRDDILKRAQELSRILAGFTELLRKGERRHNSLKRLIRRVVEINQVRFRKHHVRLRCPSLKPDSPDVRSSFVFGLALGALNNLLDNAFYWLRVRWATENDEAGRAIHIELNTDLTDSPSVVVADTGPGLIDEPDELIRPFFSRRPEGMGVGLYYANLVMELGGGRLVFPDIHEANVPREFTGAIVALIFPKEEQ